MITLIYIEQIFIYFQLFWINSFPEDEKMKETWIKTLGRRGLVPKICNVICYQHFKISEWKLRFNEETGSHFELTKTISFLQFFQSMMKLIWKFSRRKILHFENPSKPMIDLNGGLSYGKKMNTVIFKYKFLIYATWLAYALIFKKKQCGNYNIFGYNMCLFFIEWTKNLGNITNCELDDTEQDTQKLKLIKI